MAESWSTSRQAIIVSEYAFTFSTDRVAVVPSSLRTYLERNGLVSGYIATADARWTLCYRQDPEHSDRVIRMSAILKGDTRINCICIKDDSAIYCRTFGVDNNGPVVLEYPKYYNDSTIPPDFDIVFRIFTTGDIDWSSFTLTITISSGSNSSYGYDDITVVDITDQIKEIRLIPKDLLTLIGDTVNVKVYMKDIYNRELELNW